MCKPEGEKKTKSAQTYSIEEGRTCDAASHGITSPPHNQLRPGADRKQNQKAKTESKIRKQKQKAKSESKNKERIAASK